MINPFKKYVFIISIISMFTVVTYSQWVQMSNGMGNKEAEALACSGNNIFAGTLNSTPSGVYISTNNGTTWTQTALNNQNIYSLAANGNNIFAGTASPPNGVYRSTNNGTTWTQTSLNNQYVWSLAANGNNIFAGTNNGIYLSTNNGTSWSQTPLNNQTIPSLAVNGNNIFAGANDVYLSTNNGTSWSQTFLNQAVSSLGVNGSNIFAGTLNIRVYLSTNNGANWTQTTFNNWVFSYAFNGNNVFAGTSNMGVYLSTDNGTTWTQRNEGLGNSTNINDLCILNNYIFAGTGAKGMGAVYRRPLSDFVGIRPISNEFPDHFSLSQNYPNPFNPLTKIQFDIPLLRGVDAADRRGVLLVIYDILGMEVTTLVNEQLNPGTYEVEWDASNFASGIYFYKLISRNFNETKKMILIK